MKYILKASKMSSPSWPASRMWRDPRLRMEVLATAFMRKFFQRLGYCLYKRVDYNLCGLTVLHALWRAAARPGEPDFAPLLAPLDDPFLENCPRPTIIEMFCRGAAAPPSPRHDASFFARFARVFRARMTANEKSPSPFWRVRRLEADGARARKAAEDAVVFADERIAVADEPARM